MKKGKYAQIWFQTDLDYQTTINKLQQSEMFGGHDSKGRFTFHSTQLKDITYQITKYSKLSINYPEETDYMDFLERIKPFLVTADGSPAKIGDVIKKPILGKKKIAGKKFWLLEWLNDRSERKQLERWEEQLKFLRVIKRPYCRLRIKSDPYHSRMWEFLLEEANEEINMLQDLITTAKKRPAGANK